MQYYLLIMVKLFLGFIIVITYFNLSGKTQLSQMTAIDLIGNFILGGIIGGIIYNNDVPIYQYIIILSLSISLIFFLNFMSKNLPLFRAISIGKPIPIIKNGRFLVENIRARKNKIDILNIASQLHAQGVHSLQEITYLQIEPDGKVTVAYKEKDMPSVIIIKDGKIRPDTLPELEIDEQWILHQLQQCKIKDIKDVFIAEFWQGRIIFAMNNGEIKKMTSYSEY